MCDVSTQGIKYLVHWALNLFSDGFILHLKQRYLRFSISSFVTNACRVFIIMSQALEDFHLTCDQERRRSVETLSIEWFLAQFKWTFTYSDIIKWTILLWSSHQLGVGWCPCVPCTLLCGVGLLLNWTLHWLDNQIQEGFGRTLGSHSGRRSAKQLDQSWN